ncbi:MAG: hypothetical protein KF821_09030 [Anaerolineales bacterium]|nr:hypothetical protein [Anaerolineales bacterium]
MTTATIHPAEVAAGIAAKTLTGITLKGPADMVDAPLHTQLPLLQPAPHFITNIRIERDSYGSGGVAQMTVTYDLNFRYMHSLASSAGLGGVFDALLKAVSVLYIFFAENDSIAFTGGEAVDLQIASIGEFGDVPAPNGTMCWGFDLAARVTELIN